MAKQNPNDRNALAVAKRKAAAEKNFFTADDGRVIELKKNPDLIFIQQASASVTFPDVPTYEVKMGKGTLEYPLDPDVIKQTTDLVEKLILQRKWTAYQMALGEAIGEQTKRTTGAMFFEGTTPNIEMVNADIRWRKKLKIAGWPIPKDEEELWAFYLQTSLNESEIKRLTGAIVRQAGGVSEEQIAAAEELFLGDVPTESERPGDVEEPDPDAGGVGEE